MAMRLKVLSSGMAMIAFASLLAAAVNDLRLIDAAKRGDVNAVRALLRQGVPVDAASADGTTALHEAARREDLAVVEVLLTAGADVRAATRYKITPLSIACANGNAALIDRLLRAGAGASATSEEGQTALMTAALNGKPEAVKVLLARGADVNIQEPVRGQSALMWAASEGNTATAELLMEAGADLKLKSKGGFTALLFAVRGGHTETARTLLSHRANANDTVPDGTSALNMAVLNAYYELAIVLLKAGADPNAPDARGSALHTLAWLRQPGSDGGNGLGRRSYGVPQPVGNVTSLELAKALLDHGANPNVRIEWQEPGYNGETMKNPPLITLGRHFLSYQGATPFYLAAKHGDAPFMKLLAERGANPKIPTVLGITPLIAASGLDYWEGESPGPFTGVSEAERLEAVKVALELGNDINAAADFGNYKMEGDPEYLLLYYPLNNGELKNNIHADPRWSGSTALHAAVVSNQPSLVQYLVDHGANINAKTKSGWTPLMMARGVFFANLGREFPAAEEILKKAKAGKQ